MLQVKKIIFSEEVTDNAVDMKMILILTGCVCGCVCLPCFLVTVILFRRRRKRLSGTPPATPRPPLYTEIEFVNIPSSPPPRYKSEPDIAARLMTNNCQQTSPFQSHDLDVSDVSSIDSEAGAL